MEIKAQQLVRLDLFVKEVHTPGKNLAPVVKLTVDDQEVFCLVDTGSDSFFLVWKKWFEKSHGKCEDLLYGCYECKPEPCKEGELETITFNDGSSVTVFSQSGEFNLDGELSKLAFDLVAGISPEETQPWASLGLMLSYDEEHKSILQQLSEEEIITENSFSIYFNPGDSYYGEVILGGEDPTKQASPLKFFKVVDEAEQLVELRGLQVGDDPLYHIDIMDNAIFDTGATAIFINNKWQEQVINSLQNAGKEKVNIQVKGDDIIVSCDDVANLPSMTFYVGGSEGDKIPVEILPAALVWETLGDECILGIAFTDYDIVGIGLSAFLGNYYYSNPSKGVIGFTKVKQ